MIERLKRKYALSDKGAKNLIKAGLACTLQNIACMLPIGLIYLLIDELLEKKTIADISVFLIAGAVICLILVFLASFFQYSATYLSTYKESGVRRISLAEKIRKLPMSFFGKRDLSDVTETMMKDTQALEVAFSHNIPELIGSLISTLLISIGMFAFEWHLALAAFWVVPIVFIILGFSGKMQYKLNRLSYNAQMNCLDGIQEFIDVSKDLRACNAGEEYLEGLDKKIDVYEKSSFISKFGITAYVMSTGVILRFGIVSVALIGIALLMSESISLLTFILFMIVVARLYEPLQGVLNNMSTINAVKVNIARINDIFNYPTLQGKDNVNCNGYDITFENVEFSYNSGEKVLDKVSFTAKQGELTAFVGPSGGGKTTILRLSARFWDVDRGRITVGGMDVSEIDPEALMSLYSIVFQDVILFNDTIMGNIRIGKKDASDEEVLRAARLANCDEFVQKLSDGYNTMIGENGCRLSGGERQRLSIARAFLNDAPIILLDEATASLDAENESKIQSALSELVKNKTVMVIAHRMRTILDADKVVVLSDGKAVESGSPKELMKKEGIFAKMIKTQSESLAWKLEK